MKNNITQKPVSFVHDNKTIKFYLPEGTGGVAKNIRKGRFYEEKFLDYIAKQKIEGVYIDAGANIGNHTTFFGLFAPSSTVLSFEPNPKVYEYLNKNVQSNNLGKKVKTYNLALGDKAGTCSLIINPLDENGGTKVTDGGDIEQRKLDDFIDQKIGMIKIDVEGYEKNVLLGAKKILKKYIPELFIEITSKEEYATIFGILKDYGYSPINVFNNSATYHFSAKRKQQPFIYNMTKSYVVRRLLRNS